MGAPSGTGVASRGARARSRAGGQVEGRAERQVPVGARSDQGSLVQSPAHFLEIMQGPDGGFDTYYFSRKYI